MYWEYYERKNSHVPTTPEVTATITRLLKTAWGVDTSAYSLAVAGSLNLKNPIIAEINLKM